VEGESLVDAIRLIRNKAQLEGTCYFELLPGEYNGVCWNDGSVFLAEDVFGLVEPIIARHEPRFDHYAFVGIPRPTWELIITDLERLAERAEAASAVSELRGEVGFVFITTEGEFARDFRTNADALARLAREIVGWVRETMQKYDCVSVIGI
jgi:hypothetical protein